MSRRLRALGILTLPDPYSAEPPPPDGFDDADWFAYPTLTKAVPNAWAREVVGGNLALESAFVAAARELEAAGAAAITAHCGYAVAFQKAVRDAVNIPVACSSLLQLPLLRSMLPAHGKIGLLCFDADRFSRNHLRWAGLDTESLPPMAVAGIQGTVSWRNWISEQTTTDWVALERDVMGAARRLWNEHPDITHWLLECTGFPRFRFHIKAEFGRPVFDWVTLCNHLMESSVARSV
ncbi:hypothetical protein [Steroidobacter sp.]|uniref:hypothetical protein n=1 Tax=Steroidobacter sp. TaxID=1978227 RepID=UPI001A5173EA|nr:hypothetical protein [Steroidobacter sp.]MBL8269651.1 hypothetical protein [Steroidobacter sp.]